MDSNMVYDVEEVAKILKTNKNRIYVLISTGVLGALRLGRKYLITEANLELFLENYNQADVSNTEACIKSKIEVESKMKKVKTRS